MHEHVHLGKCEVQALLLSTCIQLKMIALKMIAAHNVWLPDASVAWLLTGARRRVVGRPCQTSLSLGPGFSSTSPAFTNRTKTSDATQRSPHLAVAMASLVLLAAIKRFLLLFLLLHCFLESASTRGRHVTRSASPSSRSSSEDS